MVLGLLGVTGAVYGVTRAVYGVTTRSSVSAVVLASYIITSLTVIHVSAIVIVVVVVVVSLITYGYGISHWL